MRFIATLLLIAGYLTASAAPKNTFLDNSGYWTETSNWSLNRLPKDKDTIVIPNGKTISLGIFNNIALKDVVINIYGTLSVPILSTLNLNNTSSILVQVGGKIVSSGIDGWQGIQLGTNTIFNIATIVGPSKATGLTSGFIPMVESIAALPVKFVGFNAVRKNADVLIQWYTAQEVNAKLYEIQRSADGSNWSSIATIKAVGNTNNLSSYSFTDYNVNLAMAYYRVKQVDLDESFIYTAIRTVKADATTASISAIGVRGNIVVQFPEKIRGQVEVSLISLGGQVVSRQVINQPFGQIVIPANAKGNFIVRVSNQQEIQVSKQILL